MSEIVFISVGVTWSEQFLSYVCKATYMLYFFSWFISGSHVKAGTRTVGRPEILPTGQFADRTICRQESSPTGRFADRAVRQHERS